MDKQLEFLFEKIDSIWIYGGWYAVTALLLRARTVKGDHLSNS
jgi:hypothetical protein